MDLGFFRIPTDRFHKFMTVCGVILLLGVFYFHSQKSEALLKESIVLSGEMAGLKLESEYLLEDITALEVEENKFTSSTPRNLLEESLEERKVWQQRFRDFQKKFTDSKIRTDSFIRTSPSEVEFLEAFRRYGSIAGFLLALGGSISWILSEREKKGKK